MCVTAFDADKKNNIVTIKLLIWQLAKAVNIILGLYYLPHVYFVVIRFTVYTDRNS